jgi:hypothetical protein
MMRLLSDLKFLFYRSLVKQGGSMMAGIFVVEEPIIRFFCVAVFLMLCANDTLKDLSW